MNQHSQRVDIVVERILKRGTRDPPLHPGTWEHTLPPLHSAPAAGSLGANLLSACSALGRTEAGGGQLFSKSRHSATIVDSV